MRKPGITWRIGFAALIVCLTGFASVTPVASARAGVVSEQVLYSFCSQKKCADGRSPNGGLIERHGALYGTTSAGGHGNKCGTSSCGTVFSFDPKTGTETVLHDFCTKWYCLDGAQPTAGLVAANGALYGTTPQGGTKFDNYCCGTVFAIDPASGVETVVHAFCASGTCDDGKAPLIGLLKVKNTLYGGTQAGGANGMGAIFAVSPKTSTESVIHSFCEPDCGDGFNPMGMADANGTLYGLTLQGGAYNCDQGEGCGTLFSLDPATGAHTVLYSFGNGTDGGHPYSGPLVVDGVLYGSTGFGGAFGHGTLFSYDLNSGVETVLHSFNGTDGDVPGGNLTDVNGVIYGVTAGGGAMGGGTVFSYDTGSGVEATVYSFGGAGDGSRPSGSLLLVGNKLYGTTGDGGKHDGGTVFVLTLK